MSPENKPSLEILRNVDPRVLDAVTQDQQDSGNEFELALTRANFPFTTKLLQRAEDMRQRNVTPDTAYKNGFEAGLATAAKLAFKDSVAVMEGSLKKPEAVKKRRFSTMRHVIALGVVSLSFRQKEPKTPQV